MKMSQNVELIAIQRRAPKQDDTAQPNMVDSGDAAQPAIAVVSGSCHECCDPFFVPLFATQGGL